MRDPSSARIALALSAAGLLALAACGGGGKSARNAYLRRHPECNAAALRQTKGAAGLAKWDFEGCEKDAQFAFDLFASEAVRLAADQAGCRQDQVEWAAVDEATVRITACGKQLTFKATQAGWNLQGEAAGADGGAAKTH
jgi:hypothetical protein